MKNNKTKNTLKHKFDLKLKELEGRDNDFRDDKYEVYFKQEVFQEEIINKMKQEHKEAYEKGIGHELSEKNGMPPSMSSVASSSRFCYLSLKDSDLSVFGINKGSNEIKFEEKLRINGVKGFTPHIDAYYEDGNGGYYFFECKCHEVFDRHYIKLSHSYFKDDLLVKRVFKEETNINTKVNQCLKYTINKRNYRFDIKQFLTHIMGIESSISSNAREIKLIYLYFLPDKSLEIQGVKDFVEELEREAKSVFAYFKNKTKLNLIFELYVQYCDKMETATKNNTKCLITTNK